MNDLRKKLDEMLSDGYRLMEETGLEPFAEEERYLALKACLPLDDEQKYLNLAAAGQCVYCFSVLHNRIEENETAATLLGDYFFSRFSHYLIPLDSRELIEAFSSYLQMDTKDCVDGKRIFDKERYAAFLRRVSTEVKL